MRLFLRQQSHTVSKEHCGWSHPPLAGENRSSQGSHFCPYLKSSPGIDCKLKRHLLPRGPAFGFSSPRHVAQAAAGADREPAAPGARLSAAGVQQQVRAQRPGAVWHHPAQVLHAVQPHARVSSRASGGSGCNAFLASFIHSFIHSMPSNPQIRCAAADVLWQPSSLPCLGISSTMYIKALQIAGLP